MLDLPAVYAQCKEFADARGLLLDDYYTHQGDLVVGFAYERPFRRKACFSYPLNNEHSLEKLLDWVGRLDWVKNGRPNNTIRSA